MKAPRWPTRRLIGYSAYLDDPKALAAHMGESSMMMAGSRMSINVDADGGRVVGSKIRMQEIGRAHV